MACTHLIAIIVSCSQLSDVSRHTTVVADDKMTIVGR
jgi:hypothetical protein